MPEYLELTQSRGWLFHRVDQDEMYNGTYLNTRHLYSCTLADRWQALTRCFKLSVAIRTTEHFSICHSYHSESRKFVGIQIKVADMGTHSSLALSRCLAMSPQVLLLTEETPPGSGQAGFTMALYQRHPDKTFIHSSTNHF